MGSKIALEIGNLTGKWELARKEILSDDQEPNFLEFPFRFDADTKINLQAHVFNRKMTGNCKIWNIFGQKII